MHSRPLASGASPGTASGEDAKNTEPPPAQLSSWPRPLPPPAAGELSRDFKHLLVDMYLGEDETGAKKLQVRRGTAAACGRRPAAGAASGGEAVWGGAPGRRALSLAAVTLAAAATRGGPRRKAGGTCGMRRQVSTSGGALGVARWAWRLAGGGGACPYALASRRLCDGREARPRPLAPPFAFLLGRLTASWASGSAWRLCAPAAAT